MLYLATTNKTCPRYKLPIAEAVPDTFSPVSPALQLGTVYKYAHLQDCTQRKGTITLKNISKLFQYIKLLLQYLGSA